jgi:hypothetical protein
METKVEFLVVHHVCERECCLVNILGTRGDCIETKQLQQLRLHLLGGG